MTFFFTKSVFFAYGRPSIIFCEYFSPMPGRASSSSLLAVLISTSWAWADAAGLAAGFGLFVEVWATAMLLIKAMANKAARMLPIRFWRFIIVVLPPI